MFDRAIVLDCIVLRWGVHYRLCVHGRGEMLSETVGDLTLNLQNKLIQLSAYKR